MPSAKLNNASNPLLSSRKHRGVCLVERDLPYFLKPDCRGGWPVGGKVKNSRFNWPNRGVHSVASDPEMATQKPACLHVQVVAETLIFTYFFKCLFGSPNDPMW
ncbi:hypothetical protein [Spirosoma areae]